MLAPRPKAVGFSIASPRFYPGKGMVRFALRLEHRGDSLAIGLREPVCMVRSIYFAIRSVRGAFGAWSLLYAPVDGSHPC
jgi:hypothetical protein